jgi:hypothetical protein
MFSYKSRTMKIILTKPLINNGLIYIVFLKPNTSHDILLFITTRQTFCVSCVHEMDYGEIKYLKLRLHAKLLDKSKRK